MSSGGFFNRLAGFISQKYVYLFICLLVLGGAALADFFILGNDRRTMVFYTAKEGNPVIEERMIPHSGFREEEITRYVNEVLLGPVVLDIAPLFPEGTRLESLLYRDKEVFVNLSESAALAPLDGIQDVKTNLYTLVLGIHRNFNYIKKVTLFVHGNEVFFEEFADI